MSHGDSITPTPPHNTTQRNRLQLHTHPSILSFKIPTGIYTWITITTTMPAHPHTGTPRSGAAALAVLEEVVGVSVVRQSQYDALATWLARGPAALGVSEEALNGGDGGPSAYQRILGRALSNVQLRANIRPGICDWVWNRIGH